MFVYVWFGSQSQATKKQLECVVFEKDELSLSLKSLQEEHNKIVKENEVI